MSKNKPNIRRKTVNPAMKKVKGDKALYLISQIETPCEDNMRSLPYCVLDLEKANSWEEVFMQVSRKFELNPSLGLMLVPVHNNAQIAMLYQHGFKNYGFSDLPVVCMTRFIYENVFKKKQTQAEEQLQKEAS